jgi:hypothetical protein
MAATVALAGAAEARDQIRIVGSSTVFPFSTAVAEQFGRTSGFATPVVESTGSGGGLKLFCAGVGVGHPDIAKRFSRTADVFAARSGRVVRGSFGLAFSIEESEKTRRKTALTLLMQVSISRVNSSASENRIRRPTTARAAGSFGTECV